MAFLKLTALALLATVTLAKFSLTDFGHLASTTETPEMIQKDITLSRQNIYNSYAERYRYIKEADAQIPENHDLTVNGEAKCESEVDTPEYFNFGQAYIGTLTPSNSYFTIESLCFETVDFAIEYAPTFHTMTEVTVTVTPHNKRSWLCRDIFFIGGANVYHFETFFWEKPTKLTFKNLATEDILDFRMSGVRVMQFCSNLWTMFRSLLKTIKLFLGGIGTNPYIPFFGSHVPSWMVEANLDFLKKYLGWNFEKRSINEVVIDKKLVQSGDFLAIERFDGLDMIIEYGTGSHVGHSTMALWIEGELHIVESQDGWYWPKHGIQRNTWEQWMTWAKNCDFNVALLPLKKEMADKFDEKKAYEYFKTVEGMPYGYHNFLFGWIDTAKDNYPPLLPAEFIPIGFQIFDSLLPSVGSMFIGEAINKRLGTQNLTFAELIGEAAKQGKTMNEVMAVVENDEWYYSDGYSMVCSSFVVAMYKHSGMLGDLNIQATE